MNTKFIFPLLAVSCLFLVWCSNIEWEWIATDTWSVIEITESDFNLSWWETCLEDEEEIIDAALNTSQVKQENYRPVNTPKKKEKNIVVQISDPIAEQYCKDNKGKISNNKCIFWDNKVCDFSKITNWLCEWIDYSDWTAIFIEESDTPSYPVAEQYCIDNKWKVSNNNWLSICIFDTNKTCEFSEIVNWNCKWINYWDWTMVYLKNAEDDCSNDYEPVCWRDWKTYANNCFLETAWVQEDKTAEIIDGECIFW